MTLAWLIRYAIAALVALPCSCEPAVQDASDTVSLPKPQHEMQNLDEKAIPATQETGHLVQTSDFVKWIDSGFETGIDGLFDSRLKSNKSRLSALLRLTEYADFECSYITASLNGRQLRLWSQDRDDVVILDAESTHRIKRAGQSVVLDEDGECIATVRNEDERAVLVSAGGRSYVFSGPHWIDKGGQFMITETGHEPGTCTFSIRHTRQPNEPAAVLSNHEYVEFAKKIGTTLYVCGRTFQADPPGAWVERFRIEDGALKQIDYRVIPCPSAWGAVFSFAVDVDAMGRIVLGVDKRAPFVSPRVFYLIDAVDGSARLLPSNRWGLPLFLDRDAVRRIAARLESESSARATPDEKR